MYQDFDRTTIPAAPLKIIAMNNCNTLGNQVNSLIVQARQDKERSSNNGKFNYFGYEKNNYLVQVQYPRFGTGEAKAVIEDPIRGTDLYILADTLHYEEPYLIHDIQNRKSPDDHFQDLKRVIAACSGHTHRVNVIIPYLFGSLQTKRREMESLDCALALHELVNMGVDNIITFDAHDPNVQNAIPIDGFDNFYTSFQFVRELLTTVPQLEITKSKFTVISPNQSGVSRCIYYASVLGVDPGMFYRKNSHSTTVDKNSFAEEYHYLGNNVAGKDIFLVDDTIRSGGQILNIARLLKERQAKKIYLGATYGLFHNGLDAFDQCYEKGIFDKLFTTNLTYIPEELKEKPYYVPVDLSKYVALIIDTLNHDTSVNRIMDPSSRIREFLTNLKST